MSLLRYMKDYRLPFTLGSLAKLSEAMLELLLPLYMARIIDIGIPTGDRAYIMKTGIQLLLLALGGLCLAITCQYFAALTSQGTGTNLRDALIDKIASLSYRELDTLGTPTLINRVTSDINYIQQAIAMTIRLFTRAPFICIGAVIMLVGIDAELSLLFAVLVPVLGLVVYLLMRKTAPLYRRVQKQLDAFSLTVRESLSGVRVIRAFARSEKEAEQARICADDLSKAYIHASDFSALMNPVTSTLLNLGMIAVLYFGAQHVFAGRLAQGDLLAMTMYSTKILYALVVLANLVVLFIKAAASTTRVAEVLAIEPSLQFSASAAPAPVPGAPAIAFENVSFSYNGGENSLTDITFAVPQGKTLGIVGGTGSGKSTVLNLIQRFYDPSRGSVRLCGADVREYPSEILREKIGVAPQKNTLFSASIAENIRWGGGDLSEQQVWGALQTAQAADFVSALPDGIHSTINEGGKNFSGGQKQRLTIARAIAKKPPFVLLDDSLSALDYKTDLALRRALKSALSDTTVIIVSQRISSVAGADCILVLDSGHMAGFGTHGQLLEECETYRELYRSQTEEKGGASHA